VVSLVTASRSFNIPATFPSLDYQDHIPFHYFARGNGNKFVRVLSKMNWKNDLRGCSPKASLETITP